MIAKLTLDKAGRVVIPKPLRDELHLAPGDVLQLDSEGDQIILRPLRGTMPLQKERGIWVFRSGQRLSADVADETLRKVRDERDRHNMGRVR
jgi:AbrB family looped-hinge helix DNA binding protein